MMSSSQLKCVVAATMLFACDSAASRAALPNKPAETCSSARDCDTDLPRVCSPATRRCTPILGHGCASISGPYYDERALWLGSLSPLQGNRALQQSAQLAVERVNAAGGIPNAAGEAPRPLVMVSCEESVDLTRAVKHLVRDLGVSALIGPSTSQTLLDLAQDYTIEEGVFVITPTATASTIAHLLDADLVWQMAPHTAQRAPWMIRQVEQLAARLSRPRGGAPLKLGLLYRDDAYGSALRTELGSLAWNGKALADPENLGNLVHIDGYDPARGDQDALVAKYERLRPDVLVLAGTAEVVTQIMAPLERTQTAPHYVLTDSAKVPALLELARENEGLRARVHGTGVTPTAEASTMTQAFADAFRQRFPDASASAAELAAASDAASAVALGMAAAREPGGRGIAGGLRALGRAPAARQVRTDRLAEALSAAVSGEPLDVLGALGPLRWDEDGAVLEASLESWCIDGAGAGPSFWSSGASFDIRSGEAHAQALRCGDDDGAAERDTSSSPVTGPIMPAVTADAGPPPADAGAGPTDAAAEPPDAAPAEPRDASPPPSAADASTTRPALDALVTSVHRDDTWETGYCNSVALRNSGQDPVTWEVRLLVLGRLSDHWSCNVSGELGLVAFTGVDWNRTIPPGQSTSFGFCVSR